MGASDEVAANRGAGYAYGEGCVMEGFYGRALTEHESGVLKNMRGLNPGQHVRLRAGVTITRALWGPWFYVQAGKDGYRSECDSVSGAVHAAYLIRARENRR